MNVKYDKELGRFRSVKTDELVGHVCKDIGYRKIFYNGRQVLEHRLVWFFEYGSFPDGQIDHINCDRTDNRVINLRIATYSQQRANTRLSAANSSGFKGVSYRKDKNKWVAEVKLNGCKKHLGYYKTPELAHDAYVQAAKKIFGEYCRA